MEFYGRCKRAAVLHDWISGRRLEEIEADFTTMPSPVGLNTATSGDLRTSQGSTCSLRRIFLAVLLLDKNPQADLDILLTRLEIGIPAEGSTY